MFRAVSNAPMRAYQVQIKDEYLDELFQFDAGSVEQEIFGRAEEGLVCIVTDKPETIFTKLGDAVKSVTYMGPMVDLPEWLEGYANHWLPQKARNNRASDRRKSEADIWPVIETYPARVGAFMSRIGLFLVLPLAHLMVSLARKVLPERAVHTVRTSEEG